MFPHPNPLCRHMAKCISHLPDRTLSPTSSKTSSELGCCLKVEVVVQGSASIIVRLVSVDVKQHWANGRRHMTSCSSSGCFIHAQERHSSKIWTLVSIDSPPKRCASSQSHGTRFGDRTAFKTQLLSLSPSHDSPPYPTPLSLSLSCVWKPTISLPTLLYTL